MMTVSEARGVSILGTQTGTPCGICRGPTVWAEGSATGHLFKRCLKYPGCHGKGRSDPGEGLIQDRRETPRVQVGAARDENTVVMHWLLNVAIQSDNEATRAHAAGLLKEFLHLDPHDNPS